MKRIIQQILLYIPLAIGVFLLLTFSSCSKDKGPIIKPRTSLALISFSKEIRPIFSTNCAISGCHDNSTKMFALNLSADSAYKNLVNRVSVENPPMFRVTPSDTAKSFLWDKISHTTPKIGSQMPPAPASPLKSFELDLIKKWINEGAQNN